MRRAWVLVPWMLGAPGWALAQDAAPPPAAAAPAANPAVSLLLRQAQRWLDEGRPELATSSVERALSAEPNNYDALLMGIRVESARKNRTEAGAYATRLRAAGAPPSVLAAADASLRTSNIDPAAIEAARHLAQQGHMDEALARYRALFGRGEPPAVYAREYYQTLAATEAGRAAGDRGLAQMAAQPGADDRTLLANAQALSYEPATRADGVARLAALAAHSNVAAEARSAWKQALTFYGTDPAAVPALEAYLQRYPDDADIGHRLELARTATPAPGPVDPNDALRQSAFTALNSGSLRASEDQFATVLANSPGNADALGGLGIVRLRQNRASEAKALLERAIAADPAHAGQWKKALDGASYSEDLTESRALLRRGDAAGADAMLRQAVRLDVEDTTDAQSMLGEVALKRGDAAEAEQDFRTALARRPGFATATAGLNQALRAQGRLPPLPPTAPRTTEAGGGSSGNPAADQLRAEASRTDDLTTKAALLSSAMAAAPEDPWIRVDLARALRGLGRGAEGRALVEELAARRASPEADYAAALISQEDGRPADAASYLAGIPPRRLTPDMARLQARLRAQGDVARAAALLPTAPAEARQQLMALAARPDPSGGTAAAAVKALGAAGDRVGAAEAGRVAEVANRAPSARIAIAGALLAAGLDSEATAMAARLDTGALTASQRRDIATLRVGSTVRVSDRLNEEGQQAEAFERLRPLLASAPNDPNVQLALGRLYQGARQPEEATRIAAAVLARDPGNFDARRGAVDAAIASGDRRRAEALAAEAAALAPGDSRVTLLQARIARSFGDMTQARRLLALAAAQRAAELGTPGASAAAAPSEGLPNPFASSASPTPGGAPLPGDPVSREIAQEQATVHADTAPRASGTIVVRSRSGTAGLDQLQEVDAPMEASFAPDALNGRITVSAVPTVLDAGQLSGSASALRFGTNAASGTQIVPGNTTEAGAALNVKYQLGDKVSVDAGTSPLGFPVTNLLGGVEVAPKLSQSVTLRLRAERRSVLDSLVSYAGQRDPVSGTTWGGVTQMGGHAQLETGLGAGYAYAGGGYSVFDGQHVAHNTKIEGGAGFAYPVYKAGDSTLMAGLNLVYFQYENNQRGFTLGQGGYFSPQSFVAVNLPVDYRSTLGALRYHLGATAGYAAFNEAGSALYPDDPALQSAAELAALTNALIPTHNVAQNRTGFVGGVRVDLEYPLTDTLSLAGALTYDQAADWQETHVSVRLQQRF